MNRTHLKFLSRILITMLVCALSCGLKGCFRGKTRVVYVTPGESVKAAGPFSFKAKIWARDAKGEWVKGDNETEVSVPEGWDLFVTSPPPAEKVK